MQQKLFSIITPTYNCGQKLENSIQSVLLQDKDLFEYIIIDGGSTPETLNTIQKYEGELKWLSETDRGIYDAMNKGIEMAIGRYLYFLGAGDCLRPGILREIQPLMPDEELAFVYGKVFLVDSQEVGGEEFDKVKLRNGNVPHQAIFYEKTIFDVMGKYELEYQTGADYVFCIKCFGNNRIRKKYVDCIIADYEGGGASVTHPDLKLYQDLPQLIRKYLGLKAFLLYKMRPLVPASLRNARLQLLGKIRNFKSKS